VGRAQTDTINGCNAPRALQSRAGRCHAQKRLEQQLLPSPLPLPASLSLRVPYLPLTSAFHSTVRTTVDSLCLGWKGRGSSPRSLVAGDSSGSAFVLSSSGLDLTYSDIPCLRVTL